MWTSPADGCAAALGIIPSKAINLSAGPNPQCKFSLGITEEALRVLPPDELRAGLAHEIGHVQLGHFAARKERRAAEKKTRDELGDKSTTAGAAVAAIPVIGPLLAIGVAGTQMAVDSSVESQYRAYDRGEELAADRYGQELLELVIGRVRACQAELAILERLVRARPASPLSDWLSTHPRPADRLNEVSERCPR
jgi:predicted Zn-dependent protease